MDAENALMLLLLLLLGKTRLRSRNEKAANDLADCI